MRINSKYDGSESLAIGDGITLPITHVGSTNISASNSKSILDDALCVPKAKKNLISVSKFCDTNLTSI